MPGQVLSSTLIGGSSAKDLMRLMSPLKPGSCPNFPPSVLTSHPGLKKQQTDVLNTNQRVRAFVQFIIEYIVVTFRRVVHYVETGVWLGDKALMHKLNWSLLGNYSEETKAAVEKVFLQLCGRVSHDNKDLNDLGSILYPSSWKSLLDPQESKAKTHLQFKEDVAAFISANRSTESDEIPEGELSQLDACLFFSKSVLAEGARALKLLLSEEDLDLKTALSCYQQFNNAFEKGEYVKRFLGKQELCDARLEMYRACFEDHHQLWEKVSRWHSISSTYRKRAHVGLIRDDFYEQTLSLISKETVRFTDNPMNLNQLLQHIYLTLGKKEETPVNSYRKSAAEYISKHPVSFIPDLSVAIKSSRFMTYYDQLVEKYGGEDLFVEELTRRTGGRPPHGIDTYCFVLRETDLPPVVSIEAKALSLVLGIGWGSMQVSPKGSYHASKRIRSFIKDNDRLGIFICQGDGTYHYSISKSALPTSSL